MEATREELQKAKVPLAYRDCCAHLLIPLNKCRRATFYAPWKCNDERHAYERCLYKDYQRRVEEMKVLKKREREEALKAVEQGSPDE